MVGCGIPYAVVMYIYSNPPSNVYNMWRPILPGFSSCFLQKAPVDWTEPRLVWKHEIPVLGALAAQLLQRSPVLFAAETRVLNYSHGAPATLGTAVSAQQKRFQERECECVRRNAWHNQGNVYLFNFSSTLSTTMCSQANLLVSAVQAVPATNMQ